MKLRHNERARTVVCLLLALGAGSTAGLVESRAEAAIERQRAQASAASQAQAIAARNREIADALRAATGLLDELETSGRLRPDDPGSWHTRFAALQAARPITSLDYRFSPPQADGPLQRRTLQLSLTPIHETAFLDFLEALRSEAPAVVALRHCALRPDEDGEFLHGTCSAEWISR